MRAMDSEQETELEQPHDVLAAEAFAMPTADPALRHGPLRLPEDLTGSDEPRDVLIAEEFAMPTPQAPPARSPEESAAAKALHVRRAWVAGAGLLITLRAWRRRSRRI